MTTAEDAADQLTRAMEAFRAIEERVQAELDNARAERDRSIVRAARAKLRQGDIATITGYTRETIRTIVKATPVDDEASSEDGLARAGV